jgi:hypothetical protein
MKFEFDEPGLLGMWLNRCIESLAVSCPVCHRAGGTVWHCTIDKVAVHTILEDRPIGETEQIRVVCCNCGYTMWFDSRTARQWLDNHQKERGE